MEPMNFILYRFARGSTRDLERLNNAFATEVSWLMVIASRSELKISSTKVNFLLNLSFAFKLRNDVFLITSVELVIRRVHRF